MLSPHIVPIINRFFAAIWRRQLLAGPSCQLQRRLLFRSFSQLFLSPVLSSRSPVSFTSPDSIQDAMKILFESPRLHDKVKQIHYNNLAQRLAARNEFVTLANLFESAPRSLFNGYCRQSSFTVDITRAFYNLAKEDASRLRRILFLDGSESPLPEFLSSLLSVKLEDADLEALIQTCLFNDGKLVFMALGAIIRSCTAEFENYPADHCVILHQQNARILQQLENFREKGSDTPFIMDFAHLLNETRFNPQFTTVNQQVVLKTPTYLTPLPSTKMLIAAVHANKPDVFQTVWALQKSKSLPDEVKRAIIQHAEFAKLQLGSDFHDSWRSSLKTIKIVREDASTGCLHPLAEFNVLGRLDGYLAFIAEIEGKGPFMDFVTRHVEELNAVQTVRSMPSLVAKLDNPVPFINVIVPYLDMNNIKFMSDMWDKIGNRYLQAYFSIAANIEEEPCMVPEGISIKLSCEFIKALLEDDMLAAGIGSERARQIRKCFRIKMHQITDFNHDGLQLLRLLSILQVPISDWSFSAEMVGPNCGPPFHIEDGCVALTDLTKSASESGFLSRLILSICANDELMRLFYESVGADEFNPLALPFVELFTLWHHSNLENFLRFVPETVREAFIRYAPRPDIDFFRGFAEAVHL